MYSGLGFILFFSWPSLYPCAYRGSLSPPYYYFTVYDITSISDIKSFTPRLGSTMIEVVDDQCDFCGCCVGLCPVDSIELREAEILILEETCIDCELCVYICPVEALTHVEEPAEV